MGKIVLLDELTINQIAAGEVIERPASVIKEMVENSIDAGAKNITVEIKKGGIELIKITDDGCGIAEDDMEIAFERHATSKIRSSKDLENVTTMGFRGEALASIAAIAKVEMRSKTEDDETGHKILVEGGEVKEKSEIGCQKGTTIIVENLFYNTPVRYKFLKKDYTEAGYIEDTITRIALINKDVAIKLINSGKVVLQTNGNNDSKTVIYSIYGKDVSEKIIDVDYEYEDIHITGVIGLPDIARGNRSYQMFFINNRYVKDKTLTSATDKAYKDIVPVGKFGFVVLNIEMDPKLVDVNVHPAKLEVRFQDESKIFRAVHSAIKNSLPTGLEVKSNSNFISSKEDNVTSNIFTSDSLFKDVPNIETKIETKNDVANVELKENDSKLELSKDIDRVEETETNYAKIEPEQDIVQPKIKTGFTGLLKKVIKEPVEDRVEYGNNVLESIFEERNGIKRVTPDVSDVEEKITEPEIIVDNYDQDKMRDEDCDDTESKTVEESNLKTVKIGDATIVSDTEELKYNFSEILKDNDNLNELEVKDNLEKVDNIEEIKIENDIINNEKDENVDNNIDVSVIENVEAVVKDENKAEKSLIEEKFDEAFSDNIEESVEIDSFGIDKSVENEPIEYKITDSIVQEKAQNNFDGTQLIDTNSIREKIKGKKRDKKDKKDATKEFAEMYRKTFGIDINRKPVQEDNTIDSNIETYNEFLYSTSKENLNVFEDESTYIPEIKYRFVGIVFNTYIIIEIDNEMYIFNQNSAQERILYERIKENYYNSDKKDSQILLLPDIVALTNKEAQIAKENLEMFKKAGFEFEEFGENTLKLYAVPSICEKLNTKQLFIDILDELDSVAITDTFEKEIKFIETVACKSANKAKIKLDESEIFMLIDELLRIQNPFVFYNGKSIAIKMTKIDFEKKFNRR